MWIPPPDADSCADHFEPEKFRIWVGPGAASRCSGGERRRAMLPLAECSEFINVTSREQLETAAGRGGAGFDAMMGALARTSRLRHEVWHPCSSRRAASYHKWSILLSWGSWRSGPA
jgi:hypothetical protein